jgi:hypothetical protein
MPRNPHSFNLNSPNFNYTKNAGSADRNKHPKNMVLAKEITEKQKRNLKMWITLYRNNMAFFIEHYLGIRLFPYQRFMIMLISHSTEFLGIASRASAKSWLIAVYSIAKSILYPGTIIVLCSSTKEQAGLIISQWCVALQKEYPNIQRETGVITFNQNKYEVPFHNGSKILVVMSGEAARGHRSNINVLEERRLIPSSVIDSIIRPFLVSRIPPFLNKPEYIKLVESDPRYIKLREEPQEIIITSSYYKSYEWYDEARKFIKKIANGDEDIKALFLDFQIVLKHNIKTKKQIQSDKDTFDPIIFLMEYGNIPYSASSSSFFKIGLFDRSIKRCWRPLKNNFDKKNPYDIHKLQDEKRVVSVDVAMRKGSTNDNTIIDCARLHPTKYGWLTENTYLESMNGKNTTIQALRVKQIFFEFNADYLILDIKAAGISLYDALTSVTQDEARGIEYPAMTVMRHDAVDEKLQEELRERTLTPDGAIECIFPIGATQELNSQIAVSFRDRLKRKLITFLCDDFTEEDFLIKSQNKDILNQDDLSYRAYLLAPHVNTQLLINECISLEMSMVGNGLIKLIEAPSARKDRYTAVSYLNYFVSILDIELLKTFEDSNDIDEMLALVQSA